MLKGGRIAGTSRAPVAAFVLAMAHIFVASSANAQIDSLFIVPPPPGITFAPLTGPDGAPYTGHTEGDFTVTPTAGVWIQGFTYGNPIPSIYDGPINTPGVAVLQITDSVDLFTLSSLHYSSNNGDSSYDIQGYLGETLVYDEIGTLEGSFEPFSFKTLSIMNPTVKVDALLVSLIPGVGVTSINLDNIKVATVPEPGSFLLLAAGLAAFVYCRRSAWTRTI